MALQRTLAIIKPHIWIDNTPEEATSIMTRILDAYVDDGLSIKHIATITFSDALVAEFYRDKISEDYYPNIRKAMTMGHAVALVLSGDDAIKKVRDLNGATNPLRAQLGTIRFIFARQENGPNNAVHGSDSVENAEREIELIFGDRKKLGHPNL